jgi:hypothetical protein
MLVLERNVTLPSESVKKQIYSLINNFVFNNIEKKAKANNWDSKKIKSVLEKEMHKNENSLYIGNIRTKEKVSNKLISINLFFISSDVMGNSDAMYVQFHDENNILEGEIHINFKLLFGDKNLLINKVVHEMIHGIQKFKKSNFKYTADSNKEFNKIEWFSYFTEQKEFEAQIGELAHNIITYYDNAKRKLEILYVLRSILNTKKEIFASGKLNNVKIPIFLGLMSDKLPFIVTISNPPVLPTDDPELASENRYKNKMYERTSNRAYKHFKQKLFNIYQKLKEKSK